MRFLVTDLGHEDLILGYPWLATFEPRFSWADGTIDTEHLPVIVKSLNWETRLTKTTISRVATEQITAQEKEQIIKELEEECFTISTRLAQEAHQYQKCYVLVERSARLELDGYDLVVWHVVLEAFASDTR